MLSPGAFRAIIKLEQKKIIPRNIVIKYTYVVTAGDLKVQFGRAIKIKRISSITITISIIIV